MREQQTKPLASSKITNPFFASYITSYVRAVLGEIINSLPENVMVFSCTTDHDYIIFDTVPWQSVEDFKRVREQWTEYLKKNPICIKSPGDYKTFASYVESVLSLPEGDRKYFRSVETDLACLRQTICMAWHQGALGLTKEMTVSIDDKLELIKSAEKSCKSS